MQSNVCGCFHHKVIPLLVVLLGATFLAGALGWLSMSTVSITWPIIVILGGLAKLGGRMCSCCNADHPVKM